MLFGMVVISRREADAKRRRYVFTLLVAAAGIGAREPWGQGVI